MSLRQLFLTSVFTLGKAFFVSWFKRCLEDKVSIRDIFRYVQQDD